MTNPRACIIIIGNEILSGRTQDKNIQYLAIELNNIGIKLEEVRVIPDIEQTIIDTVNELRVKYDYVFTTGGIGPTHDDITSESMAKAFGVNIVCNPEALKILEDHYGAENVSDTRKKMAFVPEGAKLILNPASKAPGFIMGNVYVMAGVPYIMQAMFAGLKGELKGGKPTQTKSIVVMVGESFIAKGFEDIQKQYPEVEMGSYPFIKENKWGTTLVLRSTDEELLASAYQNLKEFLHSQNIETEEE
jgi:molybdenum cofactor synthesis domain-containing protein